MLKVQIKEHREPCVTVNLVDIDNNYVIAYNVRRDYAELIVKGLYGETGCPPEEKSEPS